MRPRSTRATSEPDPRSPPKGRLRGFREFFERAENDPAYWVEGAILDFTEELCRVMKEKKISRVELARRLGTSPAYITKVLRGNANFTLASMVKLSRALGSELHLRLKPLAVDAERTGAGQS